MHFDEQFSPFDFGKDCPRPSGISEKASFLDHQTFVRSMTVFSWFLCITLKRTSRSKRFQLFFNAFLQNRLGMQLRTSSIQMQSSRFPQRPEKIIPGSPQFLILYKSSNWISFTPQKEGQPPANAINSLTVSHNKLQLNCQAVANKCETELFLLSAWEAVGSALE